MRRQRTVYGNRRLIGKYLKQQKAIQNVSDTTDLQVSGTVPTVEEKRDNAESSPRP